MIWVEDVLHVKLSKYLLMVWVEDVLHVKLSKYLLMVWVEDVLHVKLKWISSNGMGRRCTSH